MCGIAAIVAFDGNRADRSRVSRMLDLQRHRGPDDAGILDAGQVVVGFRRLSIIDLSPMGHQPMTSGDGRAHLVFNGEIYNSRARREQLRQHWPKESYSGAH